MRERRNKNDEDDGADEERGRRIINVHKFGKFIDEPF
jgi:hypothetical protein